MKNLRGILLLSVCMLLTNQSNAQSTRETIQGKWQAHQVYTYVEVDQGVGLTYDTFPFVEETHENGAPMLYVKNTYFHFKGDELIINTDDEEFTCPFTIDHAERLSFTMEDEEYVYNINIVQKGMNHSIILSWNAENSSLTSMVYLDRVEK